MRQRPDITASEQRMCLRSISEYTRTLLLLLAAPCTERARFPKPRELLRTLDAE